MPVVASTYMLVPVFSLLSFAVELGHARLYLVCSLAVWTFAVSLVI